MERTRLAVVLAISFLLAPLAVVAATCYHRAHVIALAGPRP